MHTVHPKRQLNKAKAMDTAKSSPHVSTVHFATSLGPVAPIDGIRFDNQDNTFTDGILGESTFGIAPYILT